VSSFVTDPNGSVRAVLSATGIVSGTARYTPTGVRTVTGTTTAYGWDGEWADPATGYVYLRGRWYDPTTGQFTTRDPLEDLTRQAYTFGSGDPINAVDPTGLGGLGGLGGGINGELAGGGSTNEGGTRGTDQIGGTSAEPGEDTAAAITSGSDRDSPDWKASNTVEVGPYAGVGQPARGPGRGFTPSERAIGNAEGRSLGCHSCGSTDPGTKSGNHVLDHQPATALREDGEDQTLYPQCLSCSYQQGGFISGIVRFRARILLALGRPGP
jgi:RHS repeat-associated protein